MPEKKKPLIGFVGQGFIGKNYADDFERRGYTVVRYGLEEAYVVNRDRIAECDVVFIAVPTPTTPDGFDASVVEHALSLVGDDKIAVIKSTIIPGTTKRLQGINPKIVVTYSPEFLSETTAAYDAAHPFSNIVGIVGDTPPAKRAAELIHSVLPEAPYSLTCSSDEAEFIKYSHNMSGYVQVVFFNLLYDLSQTLDAKWEVVQKALENDPFVPNRYAKPLHKTGRGAGGNCFIKDFAALRALYEQKLGVDERGVAAMRAIENKNIELLRKSGKDDALVDGVYGQGSMSA